MTHEPESDFEHRVADWFRDAYGPRAVDTQVWLPGPRWYCDIVVDAGWCALYIEVENDEDSVRPGSAQAMGYAATDPVRGVPVVVTPKGHLDSERARLIRTSGVLLREFDGAEGGWV